MIPKKLEVWLKQRGGFARLSAPEATFLETVQEHAAMGLPYGFMRRVVENVWEEKDPKSWDAAHSDREGEAKS